MESLQMLRFSITLTHVLSFRGLTDYSNWINHVKDEGERQRTQNQR